MYVVTHTCYIFTVAGTMFTDAASVQDAITDVLRQSNIRPDRMIVEGPYTRVISDGLPYRVGAIG